jgi:hypothetical protein
MSPIRDFILIHNQFFTNILSLRNGSVRNQILVEIENSPDILTVPKGLNRIMFSRDLIDKSIDYGNFSLLP